MIRLPDDPIAALATPLSSSAIAVVRLSGQGCLSMLSSLLKGGVDLAAAPGYSLHHCVVCDSGEEIDEVLVSVFKAPRSYTGEDSAELSCHGSLPVIQRLLSLLTRSGFRPAGPGEFTQRAFLNGKMDLTRAEAVNEIVRAKTDKARGLALQRLSGAVEKRVSAARELLIDMRAGVEVRLDYPEEELDGQALDRAALERAVSLLEGLVATFRVGRIYQEGISMAIAGATNSGKSSLFNLLVKKDRAIVSDVHGTTRDYIESAFDLRGIPVRLFDTAGLRETADPLEAEGVRRAREVIDAADIVLYLVDSVAGLAETDERFLGSRNGGVPVLKVWNKIDLPNPASPPEGYIPLSSLTGRGIDLLEERAVSALLGDVSGDAGEPLVDSERQRALLERALAGLRRFSQGLDEGVTLDLLAVELAAALDALGEITGEVTSAEILELMFSRFCVGK